MNIKDLREQTKLSQREFSTTLGIPIGTLRNWEQGISSPPDYVYTMIFHALKRDRMLNIETIRFIKMLDELAEKTKKGIFDFKEATEDNRQDRIFYDERCVHDDGSFGVVLDSCVIDDPDCIHHDVISYYGNESDEYAVCAIVDREENDVYILVRLTTSDEQIVIKDGEWYFV